MRKFNIGDKVCINPLATREDFEKNYCTSEFMRKLDKIYTIRNYDRYDGEYSYGIEELTWSILQRCLIFAKEENEI